ncbi:ABC transporter substrate-binding protein [Rhizomonospora bruguierae]|uniref:ABC transporter substrate-binding protein n=1 Tax=Rhizomonospora bruguierae TaxID=1581705 RepID=UPI001BCDEEDB|nr:ABC transporter substrate-binding protein [Micromonospora sp. NBRC 107566]
MKRTLVAVAALSLLLAGCGSGDKPASGDGGGDGQPTKVVYLTAFNAAGRDAYAWVAQEKGYFAEAGIEVDIQLGSAVDKNLQALSAGQAQFVSLDSTGAIITAGKKKADDFRLIGVIHQQTLVSIISLDPSIKQPSDLAGKSLGMATGSVNQLLFPAFAQLGNLDPKSVDIKNIAIPQLVPNLVGGKVDALSTFLIGEPAIKAAATAQKKPPTTSVIPYGNYLRDPLGNALATSTNMINSNPDLVKRFRGAILKGLQYTIDHPEEAAQILHSKQPATSEQAALGEIKSMTPYVTSSQAPMGSVSEDRIAKVISVLQGLGLFEPGLTPKDVADFTMMPAT